MPQTHPAIRSRERRVLLDCLEAHGPWVVAVHGIGGIGKTTLLHDFATAARAARRRIVLLDGDAVEPTEAGFRQTLNEALATWGISLEELEGSGREQGPPEPPSPDGPVADDATAPAVVLAIDAFDSLRLLEAWLRQTLLPSTRGALRLVTASRAAPTMPWVTDPLIGPRFRSLRLETLASTEARQLLDETGVDPRAQDAILRAAHGHPLALRLAALASRSGVATGLTEGSIDGVLRELTRFYVDEIEDPLLRAAVEAACTLRRVTEPLLAAMLDLEDAGPVFGRLQDLHFVQVRSDGIALHDAVREFVSAELRARHPERFARLRRAAWRRMREEVHHAPPSMLWRYTADLIYLIENPVVREAFFPTTELRCAVEPARPEDLEAILAISALHDPPEATALVEWWWERMPDAFHVARGEDARVVGFYCSLDTDRLRPADLEHDPLTALWCEHLREHGGGQALFLRRWLSREHGEVPSPVQAACWLDLKRSYLELRPRLRRVYLTVVDPTPYLPVARRLGFVPLEATVTFDGTPYASASLDFGPRSVDGWMRRLFTQELGEMGHEPGALLDLGARKLLTPDGPRDLSPLEFGVLRFLVENEGMAVSRDELLADVWNIHHEGSSNVVDAVVRGLRHKLGEQAWRIESVRGVGYRCLPAE